MEVWHIQGLSAREQISNNGLQRDPIFKNGQKHLVQNQKQDGAEFLSLGP